MVGGGLSGLACAFALADAGQNVLLLEARPHLGGRTASWLEDGMPVESGFHRFRGIYRALPRLLRDAGIDLATVVRWQNSVELRLPGGARGVFGVAPRHDPRGTLRGVLGNRHLLSLRDKLSLLLLIGAGATACTVRPGALDRHSVADYTRRWRVTERALERAVAPLTRGVFFRAAPDYSAYAFMVPLQFSLRRPMQMRTGVFRGGMTEVMANPLARAIEARGGEVRVSAPVRRLRIEHGAVTGVELDDGPIAAERVVLATALGAAQALLRPLAAAPSLGGLFALGSTPSVTLQIELEGPALAADHPVFAPGSSLICFAEQSRTTFPDAAGRLSVVLSPPERFIRMPHADILEQVIGDAARLGIDLAGRVRRYRVVAVPDDFYAAAPGNDRLRPGQATQVTGLVLAGDYTRQPFLTTMEGAVLAGQRAARVARQLPPE